MNAIQSMLRAEFYCDVTRNARFPFSDYTKAFNDAIQTFINDKFSDENGQKPYSFQSVQEIRSDLSTLIKSYSPVITTIGTTTTRYGSYTQNHINYPADYQQVVSIAPLIDGYTDYSRPTTYNEVGPLLKNSFRKPSNKKTYYNEDDTGFSIWRGIGGVFTSVIFEYLKSPDDFSLSNESNIIYASGTLSVGTAYIAIDDSVENGITYLGGTLFMAGSTSLTSGSVILASLVVAINLPDNTHNVICKMAADILLKVTADYNKAQAIESEIAKG